MKVGMFVVRAGRLIGIYMHTRFALPLMGVRQGPYGPYRYGPGVGLRMASDLEWRRTNIALEICLRKEKKGGETGKKIQCFPLNLLFLVFYHYLFA